MRPFSRRRFLGCGMAGGLGLALSPGFQRLLSADGAAKKRAEACILVFLEGGPSHLDTFDPKPGTKTGGPFEAIDTAIPGAKFSQHLPRLAQAAGHLSVVRSLHSKEGDHDRAVVLLHTGYSPNEVLQYPSLGSMVAHANAVAELNAPAYLAIGSSHGPGFLGPEFAPHSVDDIANPAANVALPEGFPEERMRKRLAALDSFNDSFSRRTDADRVNDFRKLAQRANRLRKSPALQAWDPNAEPAEVQEAYGFAVGDSGFGRNCLAARRMVEHGAKFVEIALGGWDTHSDNFNQVQQLSQQLDAGLSGLIKDLAAKGLLEKTLVVCLGEFGRTPQINGDNGRDHWADAFSAVLAGGPLKVGQVVGSTDADGGQVKDRPVTVPDLFATLLTALGVDLARPYRTPDGRPIKLTNGGLVIPELVG